MTASKGGRPLLFKSPEELEEQIQLYYASCDARVVKRIFSKEGNEVSQITAPYTVTGLAYFLKTSRHTLVNYESKEEFFHTIKNAKSFIQSRLQESALLGEYNPAISIFSLKNNYGWKDKSEIDSTVTNTIVMTDYSKIPETPELPKQTESIE